MLSGSKGCHDSLERRGREEGEEEDVGSIDRSFARWFGA